MGNPQDDIILKLCICKSALNCFMHCIELHDYSARSVFPGESVLDSVNMFIRGYIQQYIPNYKPKNFRNSIKNIFLQ